MNAPTLWSAKDIAAYLGVCERQARERIVAIPGFPGAIRLPTFGGGRAQPRWKPEEVVGWVDKFQEHPQK